MAGFDVTTEDLALGKLVQSFAFRVPRCTQQARMKSYPYKDSDIRAFG
jgi:hypothetical protein